MEEEWFVYAEGAPSVNAVRSAIGAGGDQESRPMEVLDINRHLKTFPVFAVSFVIAKALDRSVRDGGESWIIRFFHRRHICRTPFEERPTSNKSPRVEATKRAVRAIQKRRGA